MITSQTIDIEGIGPVCFVIRKRARRIIISVRPLKGVRVAIPAQSSLHRALDFVDRKKPWIQKHLVKIAQIESSKKALDNITQTIDKTAAKKQLTERLQHLSQEHGLTYNRVTIRAQQTRWGSCSPGNNISLNIKLTLLPDELMDYVILHELVHTRFHSHQKIFWAELDKHVGNGKLIAKRLRTNDLSL
jgi:predicted metal-dependent hydrolase